MKENNIKDVKRRKGEKGQKKKNKPWKELMLSVLEAMSLAATLPQFPLPTTVTLDF